MSDSILCPKCKHFKNRQLFTDGVCNECASTLDDVLSTKPVDYAAQTQQEAQQEAELEYRLQAELDRAKQEREEAFNAEQEARKELARREAARRNLLPFVMYFNEDYVPGWVHADICRRLEQFSKDVADKKSPRLMLFLPPRSGKLLADSTPILTTKGWTTHGELKVGDYVFHPSGKPIKVLAVAAPVKCNASVTFTNGETIVCHEDHEWGCHFRGVESMYKVHETRRIIENHIYTYPDGRTRLIHAMPKIKAVQFPERELPLHPYVLGAWLGDGHNAGPAIFHYHKEWGVIEKIVSLGHTVSRSSYSNISVLRTAFDGDRSNKKRGKMIDGLKRLNVYKNKHIPRIYLESSIEQRLELLAGIIDTDGNCEKDGRIRIITAREELKDGIVELATSLGFYPSCIRRDTQSGFKGTGSWCIYFKVDFPLPVALERKQPKVFSNRTNVYIKSAQSIETSEFGRCIQVDSADGLYLAGRKLIPTHNSEIASKTFPAWYLGHHPEHDIIACSYSSALAIDFSRKVRGLVQDERYQNIFDTRMDESSQSAERWNTSAGGGYVAAGVQGPITGRGAHVGIIDDPLKDRDSAESETIRQSIKDWYSSTFYTRLAPGAGVILIMTRWHDSDLGGWLLQCMKEAEQEAAETGEWPEDADKWEVVRYPAIATHDEPYRKAGEALHPARYDLKALMKIKRTLIPRDWEALYQQNPTSADGDYFKKEYFRMYDSAPPLDTLRVYAAWDLAIGKKESNDYTCGIVVGVDRSNDIWVLHRYYGRFDAKELIEKFFECQETWKPTLQGIEHGQIEMTLEPFILKEMTESGRSLNYIKLKTRGNDKMTRARPIQGRMQQMRVHFPSGASWFQELQNEMLAFPSGKHDDQVDAMAWVGQMILMMSPNREKAPPPKKSWRDSLRKQIHSTQGYGLSHMAS